MASIRFGARCARSRSRLACLSIAILLAVSCCVAQQEVHSPYDAVDPFIGTGSDGNVFPGATLPFGMIQWSPDTAQRGWFRGWYKWDESAIVGFSLTHLSGAGCPLYADFPILPWNGPVERNPADSLDAYSLPFRHLGYDGQRLEQAHPGQYGIQFPDGTNVDIAVTMRTGIGRVSFPRDSTRTLLFKNWSANVEAAGRENDRGSMAVVGNDTIVGTVTSGNFCDSMGDYTLHFAARTQQAFHEFGTWSEAGIRRGNREVEGRKTGAYVTFAGTPESPVLLKVALSFVSREKALANLEAENPGWDFERVRADAKKTWADELNRAQIEGATPEQRTVFYTALYHMLLGPNLFSDADGEYIGFDNKVRKLQQPAAHYHNLSDWDTYRNLVQFHALWSQRKTSDMMQSLVRDAEQSGWLPRWPAANDVTSVMGGDSPPLLLSSAYAFGARQFDTATALKYMLKGAFENGAGKHGYVQRPHGDKFRAFGYIPSEDDQNSVSFALEYASSDFAIAQFARALGDGDSYTRLMRTAQAWQRLLEPGTGFVRPRLRNGEFVPGFDPDRLLPEKVPQPEGMRDQLGFQEGNAWQYTWMVPHNYAGLLERIGKERAVAKLDYFFSELKAWHRPSFNIGNEPSFVAPFVYAFAGQPWKSQALVSRIRRQMYGLGPLGLPGNDDLGATSGWYLWNSLGLYPAIPGVGGFVIGTPEFRRAVVSFDQGRTLEVRSSGSGPYVHELRVNGRRHMGSWLALEEIKQGRTLLEFTLGTDPHYGGSTAAGQLPPSFRDGEQVD